MNRFEAEAVLRAAASGAIPAVGDVLIRVQDGWIFGQVNSSGSGGPITPDQITSLPFSKITGIAGRGQLPAEIAYEDEVNIFLQVNTFQNQVRRGIRTISIIESPYIWQFNDWHLNVDTDGGPVRVMVPEAGFHFANGYTNQLHIKKIGRTSNPVILSPETLGQKIDGYPEAIIREPNRCFSLVSDGAGWWIQ